jgi:cation diffusion facilitator family transporter
MDPQAEKTLQQMKNGSDMQPFFSSRVRPRLIAIGVSFCVGVTLMAVKFYAYRLTGSSAILSDALESIINVVASAFALVSIILAARPPDRSHPYGHGKIEYFSAGFEGALIILAAFGVFWAAWLHIVHPQPLPQLETGLFIVLAAGIVNLALGLALVRVGKRSGSIALIADGKHVLTDFYTSAGVALGLLLVRLTGWYWLDGAVACAVGINILFSGSNLVRQSFSGLMDAADPDLMKQISDLLVKCRKDLWIDIHELRAWRSGNLIHIDFHLILPRDFTLEEAHREAKDLEEIIVDHFGGVAHVLIHMDPCQNPDCSVCSLSHCGKRAENKASSVNWDWETLTLTGGWRESPIRED